MNGYTKLFGSILASTIWGESKETKVLWITMLAMADKYGEVQSSIPGLATIARLTIQETEESLQRLMSPDQYSRTTDFDGRRIKAVDGGWSLLNHGKYRDKLDAEDRKQKNAEHQRKSRERKRLSADVRAGQVASSDVSNVSTSDAASDSDAASEAKKEREEHDFSLSPAKLTAEQQAQADRLTFGSTAATQTWADKFFDTYPKKTDHGKIDAAIEGAIVSLRFKYGWDDQRCVDHLLAKAAEFAKSKFIATSPKPGVPSPATWLANGRYRDDPAEWDVDASGAKPNGSAQQRPKVAPIESAKVKEIADQLDRLMQ